MAALERAVVVRPRRERRRRPNQPGDERRLRQRQRARRLAEQMLRHRLDAVHAGAQIDAVQIQLEDLVLRELRLDQQRDARFLDLAAVGAHVRQKQRARELLRERAAALEPPRPGARRCTTARANADRIDAGMMVEAAVLDRDDRVLQVGRDLGERHVVPLFVEPEPRLAVRAVEHRVADAARQAMHGHGVARQPRRRRRRRRRRAPPTSASAIQSERAGAAGSRLMVGARRFRLASPASHRRAPAAEDDDDQAEREPVRESRSAM